MTDLELANGNIDAMIRTLVRELPAIGEPADTEGPLTNLSHLYRLRAIGRYLLELDRDGWVADLKRSVQARFHYLQGCANGASSSPRFFRTTRNRAFFDALAVNDLDSAAAIAARCDGVWVEALEYEDDFLFADYFQKLLLTTRGAVEGTATVFSRYAAFPEADRRPSFQLCRALEERDAVALEPALEGLMLRRAENYARMAAVGDLPQVILMTERYLDVQGVAFLRLASEVGVLPQRRDYPRIPQELVELSHRPHGPLDPDAWKSV